jgi:hypothetical protein
MTRWISFRLIALALSCDWAYAETPTQPPGGSTPILPQAMVDTTLPTVTGTVRAVAAGGNLQAALNAAKCGDAVEIQAGASFTGNFTLSAKVCSAGKEVWIRTSTWSSTLPPKGTRIAPSNAGVLAKLISPNTSPAFRFDFGASGYYFTGLEITNTNTTTSTTNYTLVLIGAVANDNSATARPQLPDQVIFDRCYIHGTPTGNTRRGITANGGAFAIIDSYVSEIHEVGTDNQAISSWTGSGPFLIRNNYLEASCENVMFGGADASIANLTPSDIEVSGNTIAKPLTWKGSAWSVKNLFELKHAQRVLVDGNVFDGWWPSGQVFAVALTVRNQNGGNPWATVSDLTFTNNRFRNIQGSGINFLAVDGNPSQRMQRVLVANNLFETMPLDAFQVLSGPVDLTIEHNTMVMTEGAGAALKLSGTPSTRLIYRNNVVAMGYYGSPDGDNVGIGNLALNTYAPGVDFRGNAFFGPYPTPGDATPTILSGFPGNLFPANRAAVLNPDFSVTAAYKGKATDGTDPGADLTRLPR